MNSSVSIRRSIVPAYLHGGELYQSFDDENDDEISVPSNCIKKDSSVNSLSELDDLLCTVRFWIVSPFITELMDYTVNNRVSSVRKVVDKYRMAFPTLSLLVKDIHKQSRNQRTCNLSAKNGCIEFLKYFAERGKPLDVGTLKIAAHHGHLDCVSYCVDYLTSRGTSMHIDVLNWSKVIQRGHVNCLRFLLQHGMPVRPKYTCLAAASGHLTCLQLLLAQQPDPSPVLALSAVENNQLHCLQCIVEQKDGYDVSQQTWEAAITAIHAKRTRCNRVATYRCLRYLLNTGTLPDDTAVLVKIAVKADKVTALRLLYQAGVAVDSATVLYAAQCKSTQCLQYLLTECQAECWVPATMAAAAGAGQLQWVKDLHARGCPWDETAPIAALTRGNSDCLEFLIAQRGLPTSKAFTSIEPSLSCGFVMLLYNIERSREEADRRFEQQRLAIDELWKEIHCISKQRDVLSRLSSAEC